MEGDRPSAWEDETRMNVLFSPFRERELNPPSWDQKMTFWIDLISNDCRKCKCLVFDLESLQLKFERAGKRPRCLNEVIGEMMRQGKIKQLGDSDVLQFDQSSNTNYGWLTWGYKKFVKSTFTWGLKALKGEEQDIRYVMVEVLQDKCRQLLQTHYCDTYCDITDSVVEYKELWERNGDLVQMELEFLLVLRQLVVQKKITVHQENTLRLIKFCCKDEEVVSPIKERDLHVFRIKKTCDMLLNKTEKLSKEKDQMRKEALTYKKKNMIQYALRNLRQSKKIQHRIDKLTGSLDLLDDILNKIRHAVSDEMVLTAIESGTSVLRTMTNKTDIDKVTDIMDNLALVIEDQSEIDNEISMLSTRLNDVSQEDLEKELDDLLEEKSDKKKEENLDELTELMSELAFPKVPNASPSRNDKRDEFEDISFPEVPKISPTYDASDKIKCKQKNLVPS